MSEQEDRKTDQFRYERDKSFESGCPAFPSHGSMGEVVEKGLTKREMFAGMALARMQGEVRPFDHKNNYRMIAEAAFDIADAMIQAGRVKK